MPCHGEPPGFTPRAISHNRQNRKFSACRALKKAAENQFYQEIATANTENEIVRRTASAYWVVSQRALCSPQVLGSVGAQGAVRGAVPCLLDALTYDIDYTVRKAAARALGEIRDERAIPALLA